MSKTNGHNNSDLTGDYGGGISAKRVELETTRMLERAVREQWPIPEQYRKAIVDRQIAIAIDPQRSAREATSAARCLASMNGQNLDVAMKLLDKQVPDLLEIGTTTQQEARSAVLNDAEYLAYREQKRLMANLNGTNGHAKNGHNGNGHV